jgi:predicted nucleotidyltransferase
VGFGSFATFLQVTHFIKEILMKRVTEHEIKSFVNDIVNRFSPERVILFGSHASGDVTPLF